MASAAQTRMNKVVGQLSAAPVAIYGEFPSSFRHIPVAPPNAIFNTVALFKKSKNPNKMNLGIGAYRDDNGNPYPLPSVREAERRLAHDPKVNHEYLPISGDAEFKVVAQKLMFGANSPAIRDNRIATLQSVSGTGALRLGAEFVKKFMPNTTVYISAPTWGNHGTIFGAVGVQTKKYRYWDAKNRVLDFAGMCEDLNNAPNGSVILLHACAHNPTGVDPTKEQWQKLATVIKAKGHTPFFDSAYQGFATGDLEADAYAIRFFVEQGFSLITSQSFAKNFGLYGQRAGTMNVVTQTPLEAKAIVSQVSLIIRAMYSNPPAHGARIVKIILSDPALYRQWEREMRDMSERIQKMRKALYGELQKLRTPGTWEHIITQIGMFSFTGLTKAQVGRMISNWDVYMLTNGRISMAGINTKNYAYLAKAIDDCVRNA